MSANTKAKSPEIPHQFTLSRGWIQFGIILAVVVITIASAYWGTGKVLVLLLAAIIGIAGLIALLQYPQLGFFLILVSGMFIPFSGPGHVNASILSVVLLVGLWLMDMLVVKKKFTLVRSRVLRPVGFFLIVTILAFVLGQIPWFIFANQAPLEAQVGGFAIYFFLLATVIMTANLIQDIRWLKTIVWVFVGLGMFYVLGRALELPFADKLFQHGFYANSMFWMMLIIIPLGQAIYNDQLSVRTRVVLFGIVGLAFYVSMFLQGDWKSGWVPAGVAAGVLIAMRFKRLTLLSLPFFAVLVVYLAQDLISTDQYSWGTRLDAWLIVLQISQVSPIIGMGFANYYWYATLFPIRGYAIRFNSHSQFVDIIAQTGILGLICFFWVLFELGRLAWDLGKDLPGGFEKAYAHSMFASVFGALMAAFLVDWLLPFAYNIGLDGVRASILPWIFFGGLVSIEQIYRARRKAADPNALAVALPVEI